jgi:hypothetical protein
MKRFKFLKGIIACLLSLALVLCAFEPTALKADGDTPAENNGSTTSGSGSGSTTADSGSGSTVAAASVTPTYDPATDTVIFSADEKVTFW